MPIQTVRNVLVADGTETGLVSTRISPVMMAQQTTLPAVTLTLVSTVPQNHLYGVPTLDANRVQLDVWASTYASAQAVATACRNALEAAGYQLELVSNDDHDPETSEYRVTQDWTVWTT